MPGFSILGGPIFESWQPSANIETARQYRWLFTSIKPMQDICIYAHKTGRPKVEIDRATLHQQQDCIYFPGKQKWLPIEISFYHAITPKNQHHGGVDVAYRIYKWWSTKVLDIKRSRVHLEKQTCRLELLDGAGSWAYRYTMYGCWISKVTPDELDYTSTKISEITFTLEMDKATEESSTDTTEPPDMPDTPDTPGYKPGGKPGNSDYSPTNNNKVSLEEFIRATRTTGD